MQRRRIEGQVSRGAAIGALSLAVLAACQVAKRDVGPAPPATSPTSIGDARGVHVLRLAHEDLEPGRYRITCRARDTTRLRDERFPLVLKDERGLLESERVWWLLVR